MILEDFDVKKQKLGFAALISTATIALAGMMTLPNVYASWEWRGYRGDLNYDNTVSVLDIVKMQRFLLRLDRLEGENIAQRADMNQDNTINITDLVILKNCVFYENFLDIWEEVADPITTTETNITTSTTTISTEITTETQSTTTETTTITEEAIFIDASIAAIQASLPTQGNANLVIFYVDFPDCPYTVDLTAEQIQKIAFGEEDIIDSNYPFDSMRAFYQRSSKGAMQLSGQAFRYTTKENRAAYDTDKVKLAEECYEAFKDSVDFSQFDGNQDGKIDATLFSVPTNAGDDNWWPCAGAFGDDTYQVDGVSIGHIITGNAQIESETDYVNFNSSYLHEMGHCMGLPDYYLYSSGDHFEGMEGNAGTELMDADAASDFGCFSKLMLGWYQKNQITVYDSSQGAQTFTLSNAQTKDGNCIIIPYGTLDNRYFSEYLLIEYITEDDNNSYINSHMSYWQSIDSGIRIYHIQAALQEDYWYTYFKYQNGSEYTNNDDDGIRLIRLVNEKEGGSVFKTGDVIDSSISGFHWYDTNENESIDPGVAVTIGELIDDQYTITISNK